eukprot:tig00020537_g10228.t1
MQSPAFVAGVLPVRLAGANCVATQLPALQLRSATPAPSTRAHRPIRLVGRDSAELQPRRAFSSRGAPSAQETVMLFGKNVLNEGEVEGDAASAGGASALSEALQRRTLQLYGKFLDEDGRGVDYEGIARSAEYADYRAAARALRRLDLAELAGLSEPARRAVFINLYNTLLIDGLVQRGAAPSSLLARLLFYARTAYDVGGLSFSLNDIEHGLLRGNAISPVPLSGRQFGGREDPRRALCLPLDARIHFALNCGARSCPPIRVFTEENVEAALELAARAFCGAEVRLDAPRRVATLSKIFQWYAEDFGGAAPEALLSFVRPYLPDDARAALDAGGDLAGWRVEFAPYNWDLNDSKSS